MLNACQPNPLSQIDFGLVQEWVSVCSAHDCCNNQPDSFLPSRFIEISNDGKTGRLVSTETEFGDPSTIRYQSQCYVTLSHRWGNMAYKKLRAATVHELEQALIVSELSRVFREALIVVAHLGILLVWVDSLCIMQDRDCEDLKIQCRLMHKIYASAFPNISSTGCEDNQGTMLRRRVHPTNPMPQIFKARYNFFSRRRYVVEGHVWIDEIANAPLSSRGWVFQERHLARRVLHLK